MCVCVCVCVFSEKRNMCQYVEVNVCVILRNTKWVSVCLSVCDYKWISWYWLKWNDAHVVNYYEDILTWGRKWERDTVKAVRQKKRHFKLYQWEKEAKNEMKEITVSFLSFFLTFFLYFSNQIQAPDLYWLDPLSSQHIDFKPVLLSNEHHRLFTGPELHRWNCEEAAS